MKLLDLIEKFKKSNVNIPVTDDMLVQAATKGFTLALEVERKFFEQLCLRIGKTTSEADAAFDIAVKNVLVELSK